MGSEDLFHKRKAHNRNDLRRKKAHRSVHKKVLIVCEGKKTEPNYFKEARKFYGLNTLDIEITYNKDHSDPKNIVLFANKRCEQEVGKGDPFDFVFCVFDKDEHKSYELALSQVRRKKSVSKWSPINSVPCFEYWLLLHFVYTDKPFYGSNKETASKKAEKELKKYLTDYKKGASGVFHLLYDRLDLAKSNAKRSLEQCVINQSDNPSTNVHLLVSFLQKMVS